MSFVALQSSTSSMIQHAVNRVQDDDQHRPQHDHQGTEHRPLRRGRAVDSVPLSAGVFIPLLLLHVSSFVGAVGGAMD